MRDPKKWLNADTALLGAMLLKSGVAGKEKEKIKKWFFETALQYVPKRVERVREALKKKS